MCLHHIVDNTPITLIINRKMLRLPVDNRLSHVYNFICKKKTGKLPTY